MIRTIRRHAKGVAAAGLSVVAVGTGAYAYAAGQPAGPTIGDALPAAAQSVSLPVAGQLTAAGSTAPGNGAAAKGKARLRALARLGVIGELTSVVPPAGAASTPGSATGQAGTGSITVALPDGSTYSGTVVARTRVVRYEGPGKHATEALGDLHAGEIVVLHTVSPSRRAGGAGARAGRLGAGGGATAGSDGQGPVTAVATLTASTAPGPGGGSAPSAPRIVALIIDTGFSGSAAQLGSSS